MAVDALVRHQVESDAALGAGGDGAGGKALKPLYAALNESQKQTANQFLWGPMGMMW